MCLPKFRKSMDLLILLKAINISKCNSLKQTLKQLEILNYDKNALAVRLLSIYIIGPDFTINLKNLLSSILFKIWLLRLFLLLFGLYLKSENIFYHFLKWMHLESFMEYVIQILRFHKGYFCSRWGSSHEFA